VTLWIDCDGVVANFDKAADDIFGMPSRLFEERFGSDAFWDTLSYTDPEFFLNLELMPDAMELWDALKDVEDKGFLTGAPLTVPDAWWQKPIWIHDHFGTFTKAVTCQSKNKYLWCKPGDVIVDDWPKHQKKWEDAGGHWVHHTSAKDSIAELKERGLLNG
jgi:5'(3')-deoxyribonucleotidase